MSSNCTHRSMMEIVSQIVTVRSQRRSCSILSIFDNMPLICYFFNYLKTLVNLHLLYKHTLHWTLHIAPMDMENMTTMNNTPRRHIIKTYELCQSLWICWKIHLECKRNWYIIYKRRCWGQFIMIFITCVLLLRWTIMLVLSSSGGSARKRNSSVCDETGKSNVWLLPFMSIA